MPFPHCNSAISCHWLTFASYLISALHHLAQPARQFLQTIPCAFLTVCVVALLESLCFPCFCTNSLIVRILHPFADKCCCKQFFNRLLESHGLADYSGQQQSPMRPERS